MQIITNFISRHKRGFSLLLRRLGRWIPDRPYLLMMYYIQMGEKLNLDNPQTFSEKLQWLKLYNREPEYTMMVDKYAVKKYVAGIIGQKYIIPTLGVWERPEEIEWDSLPEQFVLKTTHGGGSKGVIICRDKFGLDIKKTIQQLKKALKQDVYKNYREWPYKNVHKRIIAEKYMENVGVPTDDLTDYKFFCFNGEPKYCQVIKSRHTKETIEFFDMNWEYQRFIGLNPMAHIPENYSPRPVAFDEMKEIAQKLCVDFPYVRVDLYEINTAVYFGEITMFPLSGFGEFQPENYNDVLGKMIKLPGRGGGRFAAQIDSKGKFILLELGHKELNDYKVYCFNGKPLIIMCSNGRFDGNLTFDYYDTEWRKLNLEWDKPNSAHTKSRPKQLDEMLAISKRLSKGIPHIRVDLYVINDNVYFGELTFFDSSGFNHFNPANWNLKLGNEISIPVG